MSQPRDKKMWRCGKHMQIRGGAWSREVQGREERAWERGEGDG
jgi:hypothetical protein